MIAGSIKKYFPGYIFLSLTLAAAIAVVRFWPDQETGESRAPIVAQKAQSQRLQFWEAYRQATKHRVAGNAQAAIADYQKALALRNNHEDALYYLGNMYVDQGYFTRAESVWVRLAGINPYSPRVHAQLGKLYLIPDALLDPEAAEREVQRAL
ncbi:MAG: tetratricopeptide repeat protein, partial [Candidatus Marinimicrobia bacterium]|nr:tetratricopeptide repeat protein [Candidatus Neomarinimicrobiota bacterium]